MAQEILIIGESGSGKSTSLETLNPKETFIINVAKKPMPFRGWKKNYIKLTKDNPKGNYIESDNHSVIVQTMKHIKDNMPHIKTVVVDDFQYLMANEYMRRANERGFDKFTDIGLHAWEVANAGKLVDNVITMEGMFTVVLFTHVGIDPEGNTSYTFITQSDGTTTAKSPKGMFEELNIPNDIKDVIAKVNEYNK